MKHDVTFDLLCIFQQKTQLLLKTLFYIFFLKIRENSLAFISNYYISCLFKQKQLTGLIVFTVGAVILARYYHYYNFVGEAYWSAPLVLIVVGAVVFIIAFFGCCGAIKESSCMILTVSATLNLNKFALKNKLDADGK